MASVELESSRLVAGRASLARGRSLCFGPGWSCSDAAIMFDRNSGDYWVVSLLASSVIKLLLSRVTMSLTDLEWQLKAQFQEADLAAELMPTLQSLADNGLVQLQTALPP